MEDWSYFWLISYKFFSHLKVDCLHSEMRCYEYFFEKEMNLLLYHYLQREKLKNSSFWAFQGFFIHSF
jgi:hypothetical protein